MENSEIWNSIGCALQDMQQLLHHMYEIDPDWAKALQAEGNLKKAQKAHKKLEAKFWPNFH